MKISNIKKKIKFHLTGRRKMSNNESMHFTKSIRKCRSIRNTVIRGMLRNGNFMDAYLLMQIDKPLKTKWAIVDDFNKHTKKPLQ